MKSYPGGIRHDYKDFETAPCDPSPGVFERPRLHWFALGLLLPLIAVTLLLVSEPNESKVLTRMAPEAAPPAAAVSTPQAVSVIAPRAASVIAPRPQLALLSSVGERVRLELPPLAGSAPVNQPQRPEDIERLALLARGEALTLTVRNGDSLDRMFRRNDLSISDLATMIELPEISTYLTKINPGDRFEIIRDGNHVLSLAREISESQRLWIKQDGDAYVASLIDLATEIRTAGAHGVIRDTLWEAATDAGLDWPVIKEIADTFEWDIDFALEVRTGDSFTVVYEEIWRDGVKLRNGQIIAAEFVNQGQTYRAARYIDATGNAEWFTPDGMNVKRPFLRNPIEFTRVSSNFNPNRLHPTLNTIRAHRGVDLAAPTGTEVRAAGDGKIIAASVNGSYGKRVEIQHGGGITTLYAHLSGYGKFRVGDRVKQRDIIGFVGMTGSATGPHLHYEYRLNGVHRNPRTVELPDAEPIDPAYTDDFRQQTAGLWHQLDLYQGTLLARNDE